MFIVKIVVELCVVKILLSTFFPLRSKKCASRFFGFFFLFFVSLHCEKTTYSSFSHFALIGWLYGVRAYSAPCGVSVRNGSLRFPPLLLPPRLVASVPPHRSALALPLRSVLVTPPIRRATARHRFQFDFVRLPLRSCLFS